MGWLWRHRVPVGVVAALGLVASACTPIFDSPEKPDPPPESALPIDAACEVPVPPASAAPVETVAVDVEFPSPEPGATDPAVLKISGWDLQLLWDEAHLVLQDVAAGIDVDVDVWFSKPQRLEGNGALISAWVDVGGVRYSLKLALTDSAKPDGAGDRVRAWWAEGEDDPEDASPRYAVKTVVGFGATGDVSVSPQGENAAPNTQFNFDVDSGTEPLEVAFDAAESTDFDGFDSDLTYRWDFGDGSPPSDEQAPSHVYIAGTYSPLLTVTDTAGTETMCTSQTAIVVEAGSGDGFDPPPVDEGVATNLYDGYEFLFTGDDPVQVGVEPGTIDPERIAVVSGRVWDTGGDPVDDVEVSILDHDELGLTESRGAGEFMILNLF